jgi:ubiquinone/menaquinone biosynthesis C-methylase UbiE
MQMLQIERSHADVMEHYQRLAPEYQTRANRTCERTYVRLVQQFLQDRSRVLELGSGSTDLLGRLGTRFAVACDLSWEMLRAKRTATHCVVAAGERLPFPDEWFDGLFLINVLEHVADLGAVLAESARVLQGDGLWLAITPNGDWEFWLDLAERWSLKIPEGPHTFVTPRRLRQSVEQCFDVVVHRTFLVLPAGPPILAGLLDRITCCATLGWGFFQYIVGRKRKSASNTEAT